MDEIDKILNGEPEKETPKEPLEAKAEEEKKPDLEVQKKQSQLDNLQKAIAEANAELKRVRDEKKKSVEEPEKLPQIDFSDPSSKAWDKHIKEQVNPVQQEQEKVKSEIFNYTLSKYLEDKPALRDNPERLKEFVSNYERVKANTGMTREGVEMDLDRALAVQYAPELINRARANRAEKIKGDILFSEPAISRGAAAEQTEKEATPSDSLTPEEKEAVVRMYGSLENYNKSAKAA